MKAKKVLGLALSAMMAISAVVPWTGLTATAADEPEVTPYAPTWFQFEATEGGDLKVSNSDLFDDDYKIIEAGQEEGVFIVDFFGETTVEALPYEGWDFDHWEVSKVFSDEWTEVDWPQKYSLNFGDELFIDGIRAVFEESEEPEPTEKTIGVNYWDVENNVQAGEGTVTVDADAIKVNTSALTDIPEGYELATTGDIDINSGWIFVEVRPAATTKEIGVNYWDVENNVQVMEGKVTVAADANNVNTSALTDIPEGYELVNVGDIAINDGWIFVEVRPVADTKEIGVNYWDVENNVQVMEGKVTVAADANNVNMSQLDVPEGYELTGYIGDYQINDGWIFVEVRPIATTKTVGVNYWDVENNVQVSEGTVTVAIDANNVNMSQLDVPDGYELTGYIGDYQINDGWIFVEVRPVEEDMVTVGLNYWDIVNNKQVTEGSVLVDADATYVNTSKFTDVPSGYELVWVGDLQIMDGWVWVEVRPAADSKTVRVNYWDVENNEQAGEGEVTVAADANNVNMSQLTDIPEGYELTGYIGDYQINDGWIFVEVRPVDDPDDGDEDDNDRPTERPYFPSRPVEDIDDETTPEASDPGTTPGGGSAGPGGAGDGAVAVEDPTDTLGDNDVPRVNAPQTGRKIAGSIALLAGAAVVAVVTLKKRKDK